MEQKALAEASGVSLPTIQRMEASNGVVRGVIDSLMKVMGALEAAGIEFINEGASSVSGGRGVRLRKRSE
jgi:transcriptional regulator with XRE-family HTH domain